MNSQSIIKGITGDEQLHKLQKKGLSGEEIAEPLVVDEDREAFNTPGIYIGESPRPIEKES